MRKAGRPLHADDLQPALCWEYGIWWLYLRVQTQWRWRPDGKRAGLDYSPAIALIRERGWNLTSALGLLQSVEMVALVAQKTTEGQDE